MNVVAVHTYAGSILLGARLANMSVSASLAVDNYGVNIQRKNFPDVAVHVDPSNWPALDLRNSIVMGHPPCSCFSLANSKRFSDPLLDPKFKDTRLLIEYAVEGRAAGFALESVQQSEQHVRGLFSQIAAANKYHFQIQSVDYAAWVPQRRKRVWYVWAKRPCSFTPPPVNGPRLRDTVKQDTADFVSIIANRWNDVSARMQREGLNPVEVVKTAAAGSLLKSLQMRGNAFDIAKKFGVSRAHRFPVVLDPNGVAPVLMYDSCWLYDGGLLPRQDYCAIMGFPRDYELTSGPRGGCLEWLSRGVVPQAAAWLITQMQEALA